MAEQTALESVETRQTIPQSQGERLVAVETLLPTLATKTDIANLRTDNANLRTELKADNANLKTELKADIANLRTELKGDNAALRDELKDDVASLSSELKADSAQMRENFTGFQSRVNTSFRNIKWFITVAVAAGAVGVAAAVAESPESSPQPAITMATVSASNSAMNLGLRICQPPRHLDARDPPDRRAIPVARGENTLIAPPTTGRGRARPTEEPVKQRRQWLSIPGHASPGATIRGA